jgi:hypothetical protein
MILGRLQTKRPLLGITCVFASALGVVIIQDLLGVPPGFGYSLLFGIVTEIFGVLTFALLWINRPELIKIRRSKITKISILMGMLCFALITLYIPLFHHCVVGDDIRGAAYYPLWTSGELKDMVAEAGGRYDAVVKYGTDGIDEEANKLPFAMTFTTIVLIAVHQAIFTLLITIFSLLSFYIRPGKTDNASNLKAEEAQVVDVEAGQANSSRTVFISYSNSDSEIANKIKMFLEESGIFVTIDSVGMRVGAGIQEFIECSIRDSDVTLSIVSNRSLLSAWVALETITAFHSEKPWSNKKFIACYIDDDFFKTDFRLKATKQIDARIEEIDKLIPEYNLLKIDTNDLNSEKSRLHKLRSNLGDILLKLKESLTLDIREFEFHRSLARIIKSIEEMPSRCP